MTVSTTAQLVPVGDLHLDARNPRLGRHFHETNPSQGEILEAMADWTLDELAVSFIENGFWSQESLVVVDDDDGATTVVEGNRRLAALTMIHKAARGETVSRKWEEIAGAINEGTLEQLTKVPCVYADSRRDVQAYIGFRHVTGIKEWDPPEKAAFIAHLIDDEGLSYSDVMRRIGSKTPTVRQHYIAYRLLVQMENEVADVSIERVEERFSLTGSLSSLTNGWPYRSRNCSMSVVLPLFDSPTSRRLPHPASLGHH